MSLLDPLDGPKAVICFSFTFAACDRKGWIDLDVIADS